MGAEAAGAAVAGGGTRQQTWSGGCKNCDVLASSMKSRMPRSLAHGPHFSSTSGEKRELWLSVPNQMGNSIGGRPAATSATLRATVCILTDLSSS